MGSSCQRSIVIKATPINSLSSTSKSTNILSNRGKDGAKRPSSKQSQTKEKKTLDLDLLIFQKIRML